MDDEREALRRIGMLAAGQDGVVTRAQATAVGADRGLQLRILRSGRWRPLHRGSYWVAPGGEPRLRARVRAALMACGPRAVAVGPTAARLHGIEGLPRDDGTLYVAAPAHGGSRPGVVMSRLTGQHVVLLRGLRVTTVAQTLADLTRTLPRIYAVAVLDSALHQGLLPAGTSALLPLLAARSGVAAARQVLPLADGRAESPLETRMRLVCGDAGMPPEVLQWPLQDPISGRVHRIDAGWPGRGVRGVGVEADGRAVHGRPDALYDDRRRQNGLLAAHPGLVLLRFTWEDVAEPGEFLARLALALEAGTRDTRTPSVECTRIGPDRVHSTDADTEGDW